MKAPITSITIGDRRREDMGDIDALAASIKRLGLIQPIVIDANNVLVAGGRRLMACQKLGWIEIDVRPFGDLTENELRDIELEENLQRKDLTAAERTKIMLARVEVVTEIIEEEADKAPTVLSDSNKTVASAPAKTVTQAKVAERMGVSQATISNAQRHMQAMQKYPSLKLRSVSQDTAIKAAAAFEKYPEIEHAIGDAADYAPKIAASLDVLPEPEREQQREALKKNDEAVLSRLAGLPEPYTMSEQDREIERKYRLARRWGKAYVEMSGVCGAIVKDCETGNGWNATDRRNILLQAHDLRRELEEVAQLLKKGETVD